VLTENRNQQWRCSQLIDISLFLSISSGLILTGVFAQQSIIALSYPVGATDVPRGGMLDGNYHQVLVQLAAISSVTAWSFVVTYGILYLMNCFPGLRLRLEDHEEELGTDMAQMGETAYGFMPLLGRNGADEESMGSLRKSENLNADSNCCSSHCIHHRCGSSSGEGGDPITPISSGGSTVGGTGAIGNASSTTLNLDLHEPRPDEDEDHPRRLPQMTEQNAQRSARLARAHRHSHMDDDESDSSDNNS